MFKKYLSNIILVEGLIMSFPIVWFFITKMGNQSTAPELIINMTFLGLLMTLFIFRSSNYRHMHFAFICLVLLVIGNFFGFDNFVYLMGGLTIGLLSLGALNMTLFK